MNTNTLIYLCLTLGISSALVGGVFQAFSDFVMRGLALNEPSVGMQAMQSINRTVFNSVFLYILLALAPASVIFALYIYPIVDGSSQLLIMIAAPIYCLTVLGVTMAGNVPMNEALNVLNHTDQQAQVYWQRYVVDWTRLNHVRTFGSIAAAICYLLAAISFK
jgi:uncharacterized membrane protein